MSRPAITLELKQGTFTSGQQLKGVVRVTEPGHARSLTVTLRCRDRTPSYVGTSRTADSQTLATGELSAPSEYQFALTLPPDAVPNYAAGGISVWWEVQARCDVMGPDVAAVAKIDVGSLAGTSAETPASG